MLLRVNTMSMYSSILKSSPISLYLSGHSTPDVSLHILIEGQSTTHKAYFIKYQLISLGSINHTSTPLNGTIMMMMRAAAVEIEFNSITARVLHRRHRRVVEFLGRFPKDPLERRRRRRDSGYVHSGWIWRCVLPRDEV